MKPMNDTWNRFNEVMQERKALAFASAFVLCLFFGVIDFYTSYELSFFVLYLVPTSWVTWFLGRSAGYVIAIASVFVWCVADNLSGRIYADDAVLILDIFMRIGFFVVNVYVLSKLRSALIREKEVARLDHLTGVPNSKAFFEMTQVEIHRCRRSNKPLSVAFLDCDNFKEVNDRFGHSKGDEFLQEVANTLKKGLRATDILARVGGDEFAVVLPEANAQDANTIFFRLRAALSEAMQAHGFNVTMSVGVASFSNPPEEAKDLIAQADEFMYAVKKHGKNRVNIQTIN
jgi:diguanylate cyclase (GGDEF)-like protein